MGMGGEDRGLLKRVAGSMRGSDDGRATFAESKTNFTEGIFQIITSELPASSMRSHSAVEGQ